MATSQYIGARYVPLFAEPAQWDKAKQYEPLTIVMNNGNSYTSRQFVPAGIEIDNDAFWALTGNYNAQVEQYRQEVTAYDHRITTAQSTADNATAAAASASSAAASAAAEAKKANDGILTETTRATEKEHEIESLVQTNETDIAHLDAQMAATSASELLNRITNETSARKAADSALGTRIDTEKSERVAADNAQKNELKSLIESKFPIGTDAILDGSVTSTKLAQSAISAILNGVEIKYFDSTNENADNRGLVCPAGFKVSGYYIDALKLLIINMCEAKGKEWSSPDADGVKSGITLPSYVPDVATMQTFSHCGVIVWTSSQYFKSWEWLMLGPGRYLGPGATVPSSSNANTFGTNVLCLAPFIAGASVTSAQYADYSKQNAVI